MAHSPPAGAPGSASGHVPSAEFAFAEYALTGPSACGERARLPLRGDLAHVRLAGRCFVPHYAVPMSHQVVARVWLRVAANLDSAEICEMPVGARFEVLDIAGDWAWGQSGHDGLVGYLPLGDLGPL